MNTTPYDGVKMNDTPAKQPRAARRGGRTMPWNGPIEFKPDDWGDADPVEFIGPDGPNTGHSQPN